MIVTTVTIYTHQPVSLGGTMANIIQREVMDSGRYRDKQTKFVVEFEHEPTMEELKKSVEVVWGFWEQERPEGAFLLPHISGARRFQVFGHIRYELFVTHPFTD